MSMSYHRFVSAALLVVLAGCASTGEQADAQSRARARAANEESDSRARARIHTELAANYFEIGNLGIALQEVKEALASDTTYGPAFNVAGLIYAELREDQLAEQNFDRALKIDPLDSDANNNYGRFLCDRKREQAAIKYFLAALRNPLYQNPDRSYVNAGLCARRQGDMAGAEDFFQRALKVRSFQPQALYQLADIAFTRGDFAASKVMITRIISIVPPTPELLWLAIRVERKMGDRNAEASLGLQLRRSFPESKETRALQAGQYD